MTFLEKLIKAHSWNAELNEAITKAALLPDSKYRFRIDSDLKKPIIFAWKTEGGINTQHCHIEVIYDGNGRADIKMTQMSKTRTDKKEFVAALDKLLNKEI